MTLDQIKVPVATVFALVSAVFGIYFWAEGHYATAGEVQQLARKVGDLRIQQLEDKIFELELIPVAKRTDAQKALLEHYKAQLRDAQKEQQVELKK